jgi:TusA-related sulfurtransferase
MDHDTASESSEESGQAPRVVLDAGGETWTTLGAVIQRRVEEVNAGQIIEIISREPCLRTDLVAWCLLSGHTLLRIVENRDETEFWISKGG